MSAPRLIYDSESESESESDIETHLHPLPFTTTLSSPLTPLETLLAAFPLSRDMLEELITVAGSAERVAEFLMSYVGN
jgi:hypothetical protein